LILSIDKIYSALVQIMVLKLLWLFFFQRKTSPIWLEIRHLFSLYMKLCNMIC